MMHRGAGVGIWLRVLHMAAASRLQVSTRCFEFERSDPTRTSCRSGAHPAPTNIKNINGRMRRLQSVQSSWRRTYTSASPVPLLLPWQLRRQTFAA